MRKENEMKFAKGLLIVFAIFALAACASSSPDFPTGEYADYADYLHTFHADGKYTALNPQGGVLFDDGSYTVDGDELTVIDNGSICGNKEGVYTWSVTENGDLEFEVIEDTCGPRLGGFVQGMTAVR